MAGTDRPPLLIAVMGPTASGKSALAESIADRLDAQLINADAFQAYRGLDIGTAKPDRPERYELLDIKDPNEQYGVGEFCRRATACLTPLFDRGKHAVVVGGTGLYIRALTERYSGMRDEPDAALRSHFADRLRTEGLDALYQELATQAPDIAAAIDPQNPLRVTRALERINDDSTPLMIDLPPFRIVKLGIVVRPTELDKRIEIRTIAMMQNGWVQEVQALRNAGHSREEPGLRAIGYREIWDHLEGQLELEEAVATTIAVTRRYAKRQRTWLRSEPRLATIDPENGDLAQQASELIAGNLR